MFASGIEWNPTELYSTCYHVFHHHKSTEKNIVLKKIKFSYLSIDAITWW